MEEKNRAPGGASQAGADHIGADLSTEPVGADLNYADSASAHPLKRQGARITHNEIKAMKAVQAKETPAHIVILNQLKTMVSDALGSLAAIFAPQKVSPCDLNGHVFPKGAWDGEFPRCTHCNKEIRSAEEMGTR